MNWVNHTRSRNTIHENTGSILVGGAILSADWNTSPLAGQGNLATSSAMRDHSKLPAEVS